MNHGLSSQDILEICDVFAAFPAAEEAILFGSRAKGNYKTGSDVDIAVKGDAVDSRCIANISLLLNEESPLPYFFDIVHFDSITNKELLEHIQRVGRSIYERQ